MPVSFSSPEFKKYKFKELKVYSSTEWLANNRKKYRQVFDRFSTSYVYAELTFYNKFFDHKVWEVNVEFKCYMIKGKKKEVCNLSFKKKVSKYDSVIFVREGWGNKKDGAFWKNGTYYWEAWIEGELVATKYFYVEDVGLDFELSGNTAFSIKSLKLYEGQFDDVMAEERKYYKNFSTRDTRYIHSEILLENHKKNMNWHCELFIKYYNEAKELKGQIIRLINVKKGMDIISTSAGWGSNTPASWRKGKYSVEIIFMDRTVATIHYEVVDDFEEGIPEVHLPYEEFSTPFADHTQPDLSFEEVMAKLDKLVGLQEIKTKVKDHAQYIKFLNLRKEKGFKEDDRINIHSVFRGNPGTGKTTVAKMMGQLYHKMGLLKKGHVHEVDRVDLVGEYIGQTAPKVKEAIAKARGGVLFIDEAYALARSNDDSKDFGREVIEILVKEMSNGTGDFAVIVAGYPKEMTNFIDSNPGLRSRFKHYFEFRDYTPQELLQIADLAARDKEIDFDPKAQVVLDDIITEEYRRRSVSFGNARYVHDLLDKAKINLGLRIMARKNPDKLSLGDLKRITLKDMNRLQKEEKLLIPEIPVDDKLLKLALDELNSLIGIENVKSQIEELVDIVRYHREAGRSVISSFSFHTVFVGNPGTGKTTVARILTKLYKALGVLERGHIVETDRQGLIAGFVGQTAIKTAERIDEAMGGVLFIDEAYALSNFNGMQGDFGNEAIQTILKRMEDNRGEFFVFAAGYPGNMETFLKANPGLSSRFDKTFHFEDYTEIQLFEIAQKMVKDKSMRLSAKAGAEMKNLLTELYRTRDKYFGNARTVRKLIVELVKHQNLRYSKLPIEKRTKKNERLISYEDVLKLDILADSKAFKKKGIGFKRD
ncbi:MAG: AAA family ATPase [Saprospiraceae bacterium]|nr:AAA family ATPase [Saprospiraceae bacterium]